MVKVSSSCLCSSEDEGSVTSLPVQQEVSLEAEDVQNTATDQTARIQTGL